MREVRCREVAHFHFEVTVDLKKLRRAHGVRRYFFPGETNAGRAHGVAIRQGTQKFLHPYNSLVNNRLYPYGAHLTPRSGVTHGPSGVQPCSRCYCFSTFLAHSVSLLRGG